MHNLIILVRHLRKIAAFKVSTRSIIVILMIVGAWVATRNLNIQIDQFLSDKVIHAIVFFGFALLMDLATSRQPFWIWKGLPLLTYGVFIEIMQYFTPDRMFSILDMLANFFGILLYYILKKLLVWGDSKEIIKWSNSKKKKPL